MLVFLYSSSLKLLTTLFTPKTATPLKHSPTPHLMKFGITKNRTSLNFILLVVRLMSTFIQRNGTSYRLEQLRASLLAMQTRRRLTGYTFQKRGLLFALFMFVSMRTQIWVTNSRLRGRFSSNIIPSSLHSRNSNLMFHLVTPL